MRRKPWWDDRIVGAFMSYWLYQHLGNLSPAQLREDRVLARVRDAEDGGPILREFAYASDREIEGKRWSFCRDFGRTRLLAIDCRAGRVLDPDNRLMIDDEEWDWIDDASRGEFDHLLLAMADPFLLAPGIHDLQAWNNAVCEGAWGRLAERPAEWIRETLDLDHWASFPRAFDRMTTLLYEVAAGGRGPAPSSVVALSGDVHNAYLMEVGFRRGSGVESRVYQAVCSAIRNPLTSKEQRAQRFAATPAWAALARALRASAGAPAPRIRWRTLRGPTFENQIATLAIDGREARISVESPVDGGPELRPVWDYRLA